MNRKQKCIIVSITVLVFIGFTLYYMYLKFNPPEDPDAKRLLNIRVTLRHSNLIHPIDSIEGEIAFYSNFEHYDTIILQRIGTDIVYIGTSSKTITYHARSEYIFQINGSGTLSLSQLQWEKNPSNEWGIYEATYKWWFQLPSTEDAVECFIIVELGPKQ